MEGGTIPLVMELPTIGERPRLSMWRGKGWGKLSGKLKNRAGCKGSLESARPFTRRGEASGTGVTDSLARLIIQPTDLLDFFDLVLTELTGRQGEEVFMAVGRGTQSSSFPFATKLTVVHASLGAALVTHEGGAVRRPSLVTSFALKPCIVVVENEISERLELIRNDLAGHL